MICSIHKKLTCTTSNKAQSIVNHTRIWMKKNANGSHLNKNKTDQEAMAPNTMHSENGSLNVANGHMADRNLVHLKDTGQYV